MQGKRLHLMPIFVRHYHLLNNFLNILIGCFHGSVHLWSVGREIVMLDFKLLAHSPHHLVIQVGAVACDNLPRQTVSADDFPLNEPDHHTPGDASV